MPSGVMELGVTVGGSQDWVLNPFSFLLLSISSTEKKNPLSTTLYAEAGTLRESHPELARIAHREGGRPLMSA